MLLILGLLVKRSRREIEARGEQAQSWSKYTRTLALASTPADIADVVLESVQEVFPDAVVVVTLDSEAGQETRATSRASRLAARRGRQRAGSARSRR